MDTFRKFILLLLLLTSAAMLSRVYADGFRKDHEIRLGAGAFPYSWWGYESDGWGWGWDDWSGPAIDLQDKHVEGDLYIAGSFFGGYYVQMLKWLQLGLTVSHTRLWREYIEGKRKGAYTTLIPMVHITWLNRGVVKMYSGMGVGWDFISTKEPGQEKHSSTVETGFQVTFVGITVGRRLFGFSEVGMGNHGFFTIGMGYRFKR